MSALVAYLLLFVVVGIGFILVHLLVGKLIRPAKPHAEKLTIYECGEPTIGSSWIQFDLRFYVIALLFVIFDVEVAFFFPWAAVFGQANTLAAEHSPAEARAQAYLDLASPGDARAERIRKLLAEVQTKTVSEADLNSELAPVGPVASRVAWLAFWDILIFFGVLIVGFAYLWRRGDLDWVRSLAAERAAMPPAATSNQAGLPPELTPVGQW
jgi:NADH-quinone oxidoreductase subunit A